MARRCANCERKKPHFFKVLFEDFSRKLRIPPAFSKHIEIKETGNATLRVCKGRIWQVQLRKVDNRLVFQNGWSEFVDDNGLRTGDFLVFKYEGDLCFTVQIFDASACEKRLLSSGETCQKVGSDVAPSRESPEECPFQSRKIRLEGLRSEAWAAACSFKTKNPCFRRYFTESIQGRKCYYLSIPLAFLREHLGPKSFMLTLTDPDGRHYAVRYITTPDSGGPGGFSSGWRKFATDNSLRDGDACIFEFVKEKTEFIVHIFRGHEYKGR